jgi:hypothetical protein
MKRIKAFISQETWSPYAAGVMLGIVGILVVLLSNALLGASGAFESVAGWLGKLITWSVILLVGVVIGGFLGALSSRTFKFRFNDDAQWKKIFGPQPWKRWVIGFSGAIILEYAAGIAGGCTSGLAISGGMLLAPAAFLFIAGMFVSGIITALLVYGRRF